MLDKIDNQQVDFGLNGLEVEFSDTRTVNFKCDPNTWFTYKRLGMLPWSEIQKSIKSKVFAQQKHSIHIDEVKSLSEVITDTDNTFELSMDMIESWNIKDKDGSVLPIPSIDPTVRQRVRGVYLIEMHTVIQDDPLGIGFLNRT
jgi:hypothetical protein